MTYSSIIPLSNKYFLCPLYLLDTYYSQYEALNPKPTNSSEVGLESKGGEAGAV